MARRSGDVPARALSVASSLEPLLQWMLGLPPALVLLVVAGFAALENLVPPIPADVVVLFGGFLAGKGLAPVWLVFVVVWLSNVAGAMTVYVLGRRYGPAFFAGPIGRRVLNPQQLTWLDAFYRRFGIVVILVSRFLPMFRAVVPAFAGVAGVGAWRAALPIALASGLWYGLVVYFGGVAGRNWQEMVGAIEATGRWAWLVAVPLLLAVLVWWWRSRRASGRHPREQR